MNRHRHSPRHCGRTAFTLVELLIVIAIISVLLALLTPALDRALESAQRAMCASNQHHLHQGMSLYANDHRQKIFQTAVLNGPNRLAALARKREGTNATGLNDELNVISLGPYTGGVNPTAPDYAARLSKIWYCPSQIPPQQEPMYGFLRHHWEGSNTPVLGFDHLFLTYAYFARVGTAGGTVTRPQDLTGDRLGGAKLLFSDTIYYGPYTSWWWMYNHGDPGPNFWNAEMDIDRMAGANQTLADGSVHWKGAERFNLVVMKNHIYDPSQTETGMMDGSGGIVSYW